MSPSVSGLELLRGFQERGPASVGVADLLGMTIEEASAKVRSGPPVDDEPDYALPVWAGVVPLRHVIGKPIPDPRLAAAGRDQRRPVHRTAPARVVRRTDRSFR